MKIFMKTISVAFHPLFMATYLSAIFLNLTPELFPGLVSETVPLLVIVIFITTALIPGLSIFLLKSLSFLSDLEVTKRTERFRPFALIVICYAAATYFFETKLALGPLFMTVMAGVTVLIFIILIITIRFKISGHATAIWSAVGYLSAIIILANLDIQWIYYSAIAFAGLTCTSRLYLGYHQPKEVWAGSILGFLYGFLSLLIAF